MTKFPGQNWLFSTKDWLCLWTEQVLSFMGYSLDDWEVFLLDYVHFQITSLEIHFLSVKKDGMGTVPLNNHFNVLVCLVVPQLENYQLAFSAFLAVAIWIWFAFHQLDVLQGDLNSAISPEGRTVVCRRHLFCSWELSSWGFAPGPTVLKRPLVCRSPWAQWDLEASSTTAPTSFQVPAWDRGRSSRGGPFCHGVWKPGPTQTPDLQ